MIKCVNDECSYFKEYGECSSVCIQQGFKKIITNYDRIRNMSIVEMAENIFNVFERTRCMLPVECDGRVGKVGCQECIREWLKSEVTDNDEV